MAFFNSLEDIKEEKCVSVLYLSIFNACFGVSIKIRKGQI